MLQSREPMQLPMFIETYYWGDLGLEEGPVTELVANTGPWLLTGRLGPYHYSTWAGDRPYIDRELGNEWGAPWPSDADCAEVTYETLG